MESIPLAEGRPEEPQQSLPRAGRASGWLAVMALVYLVATFAYFIGFGIYTAVTQPGLPQGEVEALITQHGQSLDGLAGMYMVQFLFLMPLILLISHFSQQSWRETLALKPVALRTIGFWMAIWALYQAFAIALHLWVDIPEDPFVQMMTGSRHLLVSLVVVLLAPVLEELVFRGYLFKAWRHSWLGFSGTLLLTSLLFLLLHVGQYNPLVLGQLFAFALILGFAREKTGSLITPWVLHLANNLFATVMITYLGLGA